MLRNRPQVIPHSVHFGGAVAGADLRLVSVDCNSPHPKGNLLTRIADILSRHGSDAWFKVAPFDHLQQTDVLNVTVGYLTAVDVLNVGYPTLWCQGCM